MDNLKLSTLILIVMCLTAVQGKPSNKPSNRSDEEQLLKTLFRRYNKFARPVGSPLNVTHSFELRRIFGLYSENTVVGLDIWEHQSWTDDRLVWNTTTYSNITLLHVPSDVIWTPDVVLANSADEYLTATTPEVNAIVNEDGRIDFFQPRIIYAYGCKKTAETDVECDLKFYSMSYHGMELDLLNAADDVAISHESTFTGVNYLSGNATREVAMYACCDYPYITYTLKLEKKTP